MFEKISTFPKNIFRPIQESKTYFSDILGIFENPFQNYIGKFSLAKISLYNFGKDFRKCPKYLIFFIFASAEKKLGKVGKFFEHQDRSKI